MDLERLQFGFLLFDLVASIRLTWYFFMFSHFVLDRGAPGSSLVAEIARDLQVPALEPETPSSVKHEKTLFGQYNRAHAIVGPCPDQKESGCVASDQHRGAKHLMTLLFKCLSVQMHSILR